MLPLNNVNVDFFINIILIKSYRKWFQKKKIKSKKKNIYIYRRTWSEPLSEIFFYKSTENFFFSFLRSVQPPPPVRPATTIAHKRPIPRPRREGDTHPAGHAAKGRTTPLATPRRKDPPHGQACHQALPCPIPTVWRSPIRADLGLDEWVSSQWIWTCKERDHRKWSSTWRWWSHAVWWLRTGFWLLKLIWLCLFGYWEINLVGVGYFWWEIIIKNKKNI